MNRLTHFGLYRPYGFKKTSYIVFKTRNPMGYVKVIHDKYNELVNSGAIEFAEWSGVPNIPPLIIFATKTYPEKKYGKLLRNLKKDKNKVNQPKCYESVNIIPFAAVTFSSNNHNPTYIKKILEEL